jgi:hypothetical protein
MSFKLKEKVKITLTLNQLMDMIISVAFQLSLLASNINKEVCGVFDSFFSFLIKKT